MRNPDWQREQPNINRSGPPVQVRCAGGCGTVVRVLQPGEKHPSAPIRCSKCQGEASR